MLVKKKSDSYIDPRPHKFFGDSAKPNIIIESFANELRHEFQQERKRLKTTLTELVDLTVITNSGFICDALGYRPLKDNYFEPILERCLVRNLELIKDYGRKYTRSHEVRYSNFGTTEYYDFHIYKLDSPDTFIVNGEWHY